eukprot:jgi/Psemu1/214147/e_gw1.674.34.1
MKHWLGFTADDKKRLVACLRPELLDTALPPDPNSSKPITRRAYEHHTDEQVPSPATEQVLSPADESSARSAFHASLGVYKSSSQADTRPLRSSVSPAHPARFLADNPDILYKKEGNVYIPVEQTSRSVNFHYWAPLECESPVSSANPIATYHSSKTAVSTPGSAMVDRGANGCIIGNDACLISKDIPPRYVNVTGINNHQIQNIPIATCGAYSVSNRGPVIIIFHESAYTGQHPSILSSPQMEAYHSTVDDSSIKTGGSQVITTTDGHVFPLSICHGLPYLAMRKYTSAEFASLPHVIMTSDQHWNPSVLDNAYTPQDDTFIQKYPPVSTSLPYQDYDEFGALRDINIGTSSTVTSFLSNSTTSSLQALDVSDTSFWLSPTDYIHQDILSRFQSPQPAMNVRPLNDDVLSDVIYSDTPAIDGGSKIAQVFFGRKSHIIHVEEMRTTGDFLPCLQNFVRQWGRPLRLLCDHGSYQSSKSVLDYLKMMWIGLWQSEPYHQHQNLFERRYQTFKRIVNRIMDRTGTPPHLWLLCMQYVGRLMNHLSDPTLSDKQPFFIATGIIGDISPYLSFFWFEPVYYKTPDTQFGSQTTECLGHFVGIAAHVGNSLCFTIWDPITNKLLDRSGVRTALTPEHRNKR